MLPILYLFGGIILSLAIGIETYFVRTRAGRWFAGGAMIVVTLLSLVLVVTAAPLPAPGYPVSAATGQPTGEAMPGYIRLLTPLPNITGGGALLLGALFSAYVFMPKKRVLGYSLDPGQPGEQFVFNLCIAVVAIAVNFFASLPGALRELLAGRLHSPRAGDDAHRHRRVLPHRHRLAQPGRLDETSSSWASSSACCSCSPGSSSRSRCSARSASRSPRSASGPPEAASGRGGATRRIREGDTEVVARRVPRSPGGAVRRPRVHADAEPGRPVAAAGAACG